MRKIKTLLGLFVAVLLSGCAADQALLDRLELVEEKTLRAGDVYVMDANAIHAIKNPKSSVNGALHVYGGSLMTRPGRSFWHPDSGEELPYDYEQVIAFSRKC